MKPNMEVYVIHQYSLGRQRMVHYSRFKCMNYIPDSEYFLHPKEYCTKIAHCPSCRYTTFCEVNDSKLLKFCVNFGCCNFCDMPLDHFYIFLMWKLRDFVDLKTIQCCYCYSGVPVE